jgi:hypothetical protein
MGTGTAVSFLTVMAMTKLKFSLLGVIIAAGVAVPLAVQHRAQSRLRAQNEALQQQLVVSEAEQDRLSAEAAAAKSGPGLAGAQLRELMRLRGDVTRLREDSRELARIKTDATVNEMRSWVSEVSKLRKRLEQTAEGAIPEFQLLTEQDWLVGVGKGSVIVTDPDYRVTLSRLRDMAKTKFAQMAMAALTKYAAANGYQLPAEPAQLQGYFDPPIDSTILERYKMLRSGSVESLPSSDEKVMAEEGPVDESFDSHYEMGLNSWSHSGVGFSSSPWMMDAYSAAVKEFKDAHAGQSPSNLADLQAYLKQPVPEAWFGELSKNGGGR